jgi:hypothetical protein
MQTCQQCRSFFDGHCRFMPSPLPVSADHWCSQFKAAEVAAAGRPAQKVRDWVFLEKIRTATQPLKGGGMFRDQPARAMRRAELLDALNEGEVRISQTAVVARLKRMARDGIICMGADPYGVEKGVCIWLPEVTVSAKEAGVLSGRPQAIGLEAFLATVADSCRGPGAAISSGRAAQIARVSQATAWRLLRRLEAEKRLLRCDAGWYLPVQQEESWG